MFKNVSNLEQQPAAQLIDLAINALPENLITNW
jgi:hypothetical protein